MAKKMKFDFKQVFAEKGEKIGFYAAAGLLAIFLIMGGYVASKAASPSGIARDMEAKVAAVQQKTVSGNDTPAPIDPVVYVGAKVPTIPFTEHVTPNSFFNVASDAHMKRDKPKILSVAEAKAQFIRGSIATLDLIEDAEEGTLIGVIATKAQVQNDPRRINQIINRNRLRQRGINVPGVPRPPMAGTVPGAPPGGAAAGGPGGRGGFGEGAMGGGGGGGQNTRSNENEVQYMKLTDKRVETAKLAENITPKRMVVVTGAIPYKKQLEAYAAALRARTPQELAAGDLPLYRGFTVQRQVWSADGKTLVQDWSDLDLKESLGPMLARVFELEPENFDGDPSLAEFFPRLVPDPSTQLLVPRPRLKRGEYEPINLPMINDALKALKELGGNTGQLKNRIQEKLDDTNIFNPGGTKNTGNVLQGGGSGGAGAGFDAPPTGKPPPRGGAGGQAAGVPDVPEDAWLMRFIDITIEPGYAYRYRIELKVLNPNYRRPVKELTMPKYSEEEELRSPWFELPDTVVVPNDEFLYAAAKDERGRRVTEKLLQENSDVTYLQIQRWADYVRPNGLTRAEPIGDWLVADIKAHRGQFVAEAPKVKLPLWSLIAGTFLFRDPPTPRTPMSMFAPRPRADGQWIVDFSPQPSVLLVDFEGGNGTYTANKKQVIDQAEVSMLMISDDGKIVVRRSQLDLADADRQKREENWKRWLDQVAAETDKWRNANPPTTGPGAPGGVLMPGGPGGGGASPGG